jgi:Transporter associated domain
VGGYVFGELGRLPKRGDMVRANDYSLRVESVRQNRVEAVRIRDHEPGRRMKERGGNGRPAPDAGAEASADAAGAGSASGSPAGASSASAE